MSDFRYIISTYISSSEFNRLRKNGIEIRSWADGHINDWNAVVQQEWMTKKLRRKIKMLLNFNVLILPSKPLINFNYEASEMEEPMRSAYIELNKKLFEQFDEQMMKLIFSGE